MNIKNNNFKMFMFGSLVACFFFVNCSKEKDTFFGATVAGPYINYFATEDGFSLEETSDSVFVVCAKTLGWEGFSCICTLKNNPPYMKFFVPVEEDLCDPE